MPRLFLAVDLPEDARDSLAGIASGIPGADWVESESYHLTLRFLGDVPDDSFHALREGLGGLIARSFYFSIRGVGVFPLRGDPEILWAGVPRTEELLRLRHKVESILGRYGVGPDPRKYFPHVTLARIKQTRLEWVGPYVASHSLFCLPEIPAQGFSLFSSKLTPEGAIHTLEAAYPLEGILEAGETGE